MRDHRVSPRYCQLAWVISSDRCVSVNTVPCHISPDRNYKVFDYSTIINNCDSKVEVIWEIGHSKQVHPCENVTDKLGMNIYEV